MDRLASELCFWLEIVWLPLRIDINKYARDEFYIVRKAICSGGIKVQPICRHIVFDDILEMYCSTNGKFIDDIWILWGLAHCVLFLLHVSDFIMIRLIHGEVWNQKSLDKIAIADWGIKFTYFS